MIRAIIGPGKYVQGDGVLKHIKEHTLKLGSSFFIIASENALKGQDR